MSDRRATMMKDYFRVEIRCDHVTPEGTHRTPVIALATYSEDAEMWEYVSASSGPAATSIEEKKARIRELHSGDQRRLQATEVQSPDRAELYGEPGPTSERIKFSCALPSCRRSVVANRARLDEQMDRVRHAGLHAVPLSML